MIGQTKIRKRKTLPRPCVKCGNRFQPTSKFNKFCEECLKEKRTGKKLRKNYE